MDSSAKVDKYPKLHTPIFLDQCDRSFLSYKVEKTRDKMTIKDEKGENKDLDEKWELVAHYTYPDGKTERLHLTYDVLPCFIMKGDSKYGGPKRKIFATVDRARLVFKSVVALENALREVFIETLLSQDCSKVFGAWKVPIANGKSVVEVPYPTFIAAKLAEAPNVIIGTGKAKKELPLEDVEQGFVDKLALEEFVRTSNLIANVDDDTKKPCKFIEVTGYPSSAKSDSAEDIKKFEMMKVEGSRKLNVFCNNDLRGRLLHEKLLPEAGWLMNGDGKTFRTTDYHLMTYIPKGQTPWISFSSTIKWRPSISKETGTYSIVIEEDISSGSLADIKPSEFVARSDPALERYQQEFANGDPTSANVPNASLLNQVANGEVGEGEEDCD